MLTPGRSVLRNTLSLTKVSNMLLTFLWRNAQQQVIIKLYLYKQHLIHVCHELQYTHVYCVYHNTRCCPLFYFIKCEQFACVCVTTHTPSVEKGNKHSTGVSSFSPSHRLQGLTPHKKTEIQISYKKYEIVYYRLQDVVTHRRWVIHLLTWW